MVSRLVSGRMEESNFEVNASVDSMYENMWGQIMAGNLQNFEMGSVRESLKTIMTIAASKQY